MPIIFIIGIKAKSLLGAWFAYMQTSRRKLVLAQNYDCTKSLSCAQFAQRGTYRMALPSAVFSSLLSAVL
ncbi:MAG: hypothetical protein OXT03_07030 [Alphaproteobacteria bacterium]|nr:hypothetical protein [Alphaproteobacteria bacterium]